MKDETYMIKDGQVAKVAKKDNLDRYFTDAGNLIEMIKSKIQVRCHYVTKFEMNGQSKLGIVIGGAVALNDDARTMRIIERFLDDSDDITVDCINYRMVDYDFIHFEELKVSQIRMIVQCLFNEKLGCLTRNERLNISCYRKFSLENLLYKKPLDNLLLSNRNCGVMVIFSDDTIVKTLTKEWHDAELDVIASNRPFDEREIVIRIYTRSLMIHLPELDGINEYQANYFYKMVCELLQLEEKHNQSQKLIVNVGYRSYNGLVELIDGYNVDDSLSELYQLALQLSQKGKEKSRKLRRKKENEI